MSLNYSRDIHRLPSFNFMKTQNTAVIWVRGAGLWDGPQDELCLSLADHIKVASDSLQNDSCPWWFPPKNKSFLCLLFTTEVACSSPVWFCRSNQKVWPVTHLNILLEYRSYIPTWAMSVLYTGENCAARFTDHVVSNKYCIVYKAAIHLILKMSSPVYPFFAAFRGMFCLGKRLKEYVLFLKKECPIG